MPPGPKVTGENRTRSAAHPVPRTWFWSSSVESLLSWSGPEPLELNSQPTWSSCDRMTENLSLCCVVLHVCYSSAWRHPLQKVITIINDQHMFACLRKWRCRIKTAVVLKIWNNLLSLDRTQLYRHNYNSYNFRLLPQTFSLNSSTSITSCQWAADLGSACHTEHHGDVGNWIFLSNTFISVPQMKFYQGDMKLLVFHVHV